jgi:hypothetical protein
MTMMKKLLISLCFTLGLTAHSQTIDWQGIVQPNRQDHLTPASLTHSRAMHLKRMLLRKAKTWESCEGDTTWADSIKALRMPRDFPGGMLIEANQGCARGGQGANGAMWLIRWRGDEPILLGNLDGWFYRTLSTTSHGLPDVTTGWHMSSREWEITLYRFDGHLYQTAGGANVTCDDDGDGACVAHPSESKLK